MDKGEYELEIKNLNLVENFIQERINEYENDKNELITKIDGLNEYMNSMQLKPDEEVNVYEMIDERCSFIENIDKKIKRLNKVKGSPYFAKVVFDDDGMESIYLGITDISDDNDRLVVDWRCPISSLFYNSSLGKTSFVSPAGVQEVTLLQKRQLTIKNAELEYFCDTNTTLNDELLIETLSRDASPYMSNIISSIQQEQDEIIRQPLTKSIVLEGVAGSGKTSIAMHRIAYLLYANKNQITHDNILIISPNELFTKYISSLLPELGEQQVDTISLKKLLLREFPNFKNIESKSDMMEDILQNNKERLAFVKYKNSEEYAEKLCKFLTDFNVEECIGTVIVGNKKIDVSNLKFYYCLKPENSYKIFLRVDYIIDQILESFFYKEKHDKVNIYRRQMKEMFTAKIYQTKPFLTFLKENNLHTTIINQTLSYEDLSAYAFVEMCINGFNTKPMIKQLYIDEMQDYAVTSLLIIKEMFINANITIVGDYNQNLIGSPSNLNYIVNNFKNIAHYHLNTSYRSTSNIMRFANSIISQEYTQKPIREGEKPQIFMCDTTENKIKNIHNIIEKISSSQSLAIICKTQKEAEELSVYLPEFLLITNESNIYQFFEHKHIITTSFISKGLEFDNVIINDISNKTYNSDDDKKILYVNITRALHRIYALCQGELCSFINEDLISLQ